MSIEFTENLVIVDGRECLERSVWNRHVRGYHVHGGPAQVSTSSFERAVREAGKAKRANGKRDITIHVYPIGVTIELGSVMSWTSAVSLNRDTRHRVVNQVARAIDDAEIAASTDPDTIEAERRARANHAEFYPSSTWDAVMVHVRNDYRRTAQRAIIAERAANAPVIADSDSLSVPAKPIQTDDPQSSDSTIGDSANTGKFSSSVSVTFGSRRNDGDCYRCAVMVAGTEIGELYKEIGVMDGYSATHGVEAVFGLCPNEGGNLSEVKRGILSEAKQVDWDAIDWVADVGIDCPIKRQTDTGAIPWLSDAELDCYHSNASESESAPNLGVTQAERDADRIGRDYYADNRMADWPVWQELAEARRKYWRGRAAHANRVEIVEVRMSANGPAVAWVDAIRHGRTRNPHAETFQVHQCASTGEFYAVSPATMAHVGDDDLNAAIEHRFLDMAIAEKQASIASSTGRGIPDSALRRATQALIDSSMDAVDAMENMLAPMHESEQASALLNAETNLRAAYTDANVLLNPSEYDAATIAGVVKRFS